MFIELLVYDAANPAILGSLGGVLTTRALSEGCE